MIQLSGTKQLACSPDRVYSELSDISRLAATLPDVKTVKSATVENAVIVVAPSLSFIKGELETAITRTAATPPNHAAMNIHSKGIGTSVTVQAAFTLTAVEAGTQIDWQAQVTELGGLLKLLPSSLLKGAAQKVIDNWLDSLAQRFAGT